jgi:hypothetical protein
LPDAIDDARQLIQSRLADLDVEAKQLERALASLGEGSGPRRRRPGRPAKAATAPAPGSTKPKPRASRKPGGAKRAKRGQRQEELLAAVKKMRGASPAELADAIGIGSNQAYGLIRKAEADGRIKKKGQGYALKG